MVNVSLDVKGEGTYIIKLIGKQRYLYKGYYQKGKQKWDLVGNIKEIDPQDANLIKARVLIVRKEAGDIFQKYFAGKIDKIVAKNELIKLLDR